VVAQSLSSFNEHEDYHRPSDEAQTLDYAHLEGAARVAYAAAATLADGSLQPAWVEGRAPRELVDLDNRDEGSRAARHGKPAEDAKQDQDGAEDEDG
jgi:hypothetical protein